MKKLIVIALILSILTGFAVFKYADNLKKSFSVKSEPAVVANAFIAKNTAITPEMVTVKQLPPDAVIAGTAKSINELKDKITKENIYPNEPVLTSKLSSTNDKHDLLSYEIKENYRALTIKTDEIIGVGNNLTAGDHIDILVTLPDKTSAQGIVSKAIAENIEIVRVTATADNPSQYTSVTVLVPAADALKVYYAITEGKYSLALRSVLDKNVMQTADYIP